MSGMHDDFHRLDRPSWSPASPAAGRTGPARCPARRRPAPLGRPRRSPGIPASAAPAGRVPAACSDRTAGCPLSPGTGARAHWPLRSGYFARQTPARCKRRTSADRQMLQATHDRACISSRSGAPCSARQRLRCRIPTRQAPHGRRRYRRRPLRTCIITSWADSRNSSDPAAAGPSCRASACRRRCACRPGLRAEHTDCPRGRSPRPRPAAASRGHIAC